MNDDDRSAHDVTTRQTVTLLLTRLGIPESYVGDPLLLARVEAQLCARVDQLLDSARELAELKAHLGELDQAIGMQRMTATPNGTWTERRLAAVRALVGSHPGGLAEWASWGALLGELGLSIEASLNQVVDKIRDLKQLEWHWSDLGKELLRALEVKEPGTVADALNKVKSLRESARLHRVGVQVLNELGLSAEGGATVEDVLAKIRLLKGAALLAEVEGLRRKRDPRNGPSVMVNRQLLAQLEESARVLAGVHKNVPLPEDPAAAQAVIESWARDSSALTELVRAVREGFPELAEAIEADLRESWMYRDAAESNRSFVSPTAGAREWARRLGPAVGALRGRAAKGCAWSEVVESLRQRFPLSPNPAVAAVELVRWAESARQLSLLGARLFGAEGDEHRPEVIVDAAREHADAADHFAGLLVQLRTALGLSDDVSDEDLVRIAGERGGRMRHERFRVVADQAWWGGRRFWVLDRLTGERFRSGSPELARQNAEARNRAFSEGEGGEDSHIFLGGF